MENRYPIEVIDKLGQEETFVILGEGYQTRIKFRGVWFEGTGLASFKPVEGTDASLLRQFDIRSDGCLKAYVKLKTRIPRTVWRTRTNPLHAELDALLDKVSDAQPPEKYPELWKPFLSLPETYLQELAGDTYIKDRVAGMALRYIGYPKLKAYLPKLLEFLQDINWPAAGHVGELLASIGEPVIPHIKYVFKHAPDDTIWHLWILSHVVSQWSTEHILQLRKELFCAAEKHYDGEGANLEAIRILGIHKLVEREWLSDMLEKKRKELHEMYLDEVKRVETSGEDEEWLKRVQQTKEEYIEKGKLRAERSYKSEIEDIDELTEELLQN